jgi:ligand-binding sensor domain-containing protein
MPIRALAFDHRGQLWIGTMEGLYRLASDGRSLLRAWPAAGEAAMEVRAIVEAPDHRLWISLSRQGVLRFDPVNGHTLQLREQPGVTSGLPEDGINALMVDQGGMLWLGGDFRGVTVTDPLGTRFGYILNLDSGGRHNPATDDSVRAIAEDANGALWLGTDDARFLRYDPIADRFDDFTTRLPHDARADAARPAPRQHRSGFTGQLQRYADTQPHAVAQWSTMDRHCKQRRAPLFARW